MKASGKALPAESLQAEQEHTAGRDKPATDVGEKILQTEMPEAPDTIDERIVRFLKRHHVLTLATVSDGAPYCSNAFYCYDRERNLIIFTSDASTRHAQEMLCNPQVAASVVLETKIVGRVQGLQLCGKAARADEAARRAYLKRFPYAALAELTLWAVEPYFMKLTDNTLGFGKNLIWNNR